MKRFLTTTALVLAMTGAASAQTETMGFGEVQMQQGDFYASDLIGMRIYNAATPMAADARIADGGEAEWDDIGEINDIILTADGTVSAVILGVGGFLGVGERDVAVSMNAITVVREDGDSNDRFLVVSTSKEALEAAAPYEREMSGEMKPAMTTDTNAAMGTSAEMTADADVKTDADMKAGADMGATTMPADPDRTMLTRPTVTREGYSEANIETVTQMTVESLEGATVYGANDESVGEIDSLIVGDDGKITEVVVNVGGFLGLGEKSVAVTFDELQVLTEDGGDDYRVYIDSTKEALKSQPEYEAT